MRPRCASGAPVSGDVFLPVLSQASMDDRSYVLPSAAITGCCISSIYMGQHRLSGWSPPEVAAADAEDAEAAATILLASSAGTPTPHKSSTVSNGNASTSICSRANVVSSRSRPRRFRRAATSESAAVLPVAASADSRAAAAAARRALRLKAFGAAFDGAGAGV